jgi:hypothetical protein
VQDPFGVLDRVGDRSQVGARGRVEQPGAGTRTADLDEIGPLPVAVPGGPLGVEGDRAVVTSGWGSNGVDIYKVGNGAPTFSQFNRTRGWWSNSLSRQGDTLYLASGYWGVQAIGLK